VASSHSGWREVNFTAAIVAILMAILIVVAQGHNAIGVDRDGGVWRGRIQRDRSGEEFIVWKHMRSEFPADTPAEGEPR
jgi:hypothetical protein